MSISLIALFEFWYKALWRRTQTLHRAIMEKYFKLRKLQSPAKEQGKLLLEMLKGLSAHAQKEENFIPPLMKRLNEKQLNRINEIARHLGYNL